MSRTPKRATSKPTLRIAKSIARLRRIVKDLEVPDGLRRTAKNVEVPDGLRRIVKDLEVPVGLRRTAKNVDGVGRGPFVYQ